MVVLSPGEDGRLRVVHWPIRCKDHRRQARDSHIGVSRGDSPVEVEVKKGNGPLYGTLAEVNVVEYKEVVDTWVKHPHILDVLDDQRILGMCGTAKGCAKPQIRGSNTGL